MSTRQPESSSIVLELAPLDAFAGLAPDQTLTMTIDKRTSRE